METLRKINKKELDIRTHRVHSLNMKMNELRKNIETLAAQENKTSLEIITQLQAGAALTENNELLDMLCEVKWDYITA